jgi:peptidyl-prolyl cis-trans isomerase A (cyclophilin A)
MKLKSSVICLFVLAINMSFGQTKKSVKPNSKAQSSTAVKAVAKPTTKPSNASSEGIFAEFVTSKGSINVQLEYKKTPITVANFISLAEGTNTAVSDEKLKGKPFYNGLKFHRVIADFMIQGGDPAGNGSGGPGYAFKDEITDAKFDKGGILAMANAGPKTNGSQFFITHKDTPWLTGKHTIFGYVTKGQDIVNAIKQDDLINKVIITRFGNDAKAFDAPKIFSDYMANKSGEDAKEAAELARKEAENKAEYMAKYGAIMAEKVAFMGKMKATATETPSGLKYKMLKTGEGKKPTESSTVYIHYAGYFEDGSIFDSSYEDVCKSFGTFDQNRAMQNGYAPFPFQYGNKSGLIPGFLEGLNLLSFGDKVMLFIPSKLGYGPQGYGGGKIPPNSNLIFELEMLETPPTK